MAEQTTFTIAVVGATGAVGQKIVQLLEERDMPIGELKLLSSKRSAGKKVRFKNEELTVEEAAPESFENVDIALFSAGGSISKKLAPEAVERGAVVVDNTSAYRLDDQVPLVVPEVNEDDLQSHNGIIANPNCSTIQMVAILKPIQEAFGLNRVIVSTYQAVSGSGNEACDELEEQTRQYMNGDEMTADQLPVKGDEKHFPIAFNALPQIDSFQENGYTFEEMKMIHESKKILHDQKLAIAATCVRLPIFTSHAESVYAEVENNDLTVNDIQDELERANGVVVEDDPTTQTYPTPLSAEGKEDVFAGRIRKDLDNDYGFHFWIVSDNLIKGAALNTIQIAERLIHNKWL
ncbi:aspartate-semialdehyde dehydrogenase [Lentibacillus halophilus]|uniref:Aspartate-semialdehyde dehydrogenase n=1 Tax=Lentibacillus halophilus TaxID=295065 RepID=A0ABN0ZED3_9BACI